MTDNVMYRRNHATRRFAEHSPLRERVSFEKRTVICPCGATVVMADGHMAVHVEYLGFTRCPYSNRSHAEALEMDKNMTDAYLLPGEGGFGDEEAQWN